MLQKIVINFKSGNSLDHFYSHTLSKQKVLLCVFQSKKNIDELPDVIIHLSPKENSVTTDNPT